MMFQRYKLLSTSTGLTDRLKAGGLHLFGSLVVAVVVALLVFGIWYPDEFRYLAGGTELLVLIMTVDVVMGPLLTVAVFNRAKAVRHLQWDISIIALLQLSALAYGIYTVSLARPVALVFEFDRFRVVSYAEVVLTEFSEALPEFRSIALNGPITVSVRRSEVGVERSNALATAIFEGIDTSQRPKFWIPYGPTEQAEAFRVGRPLQLLLEKYNEAGSEIESLLEKKNMDIRFVKFLPVNARGVGVAVIDRQGVLLGFLPYDGYF